MSVNCRLAIVPGPRKHNRGQFLPQNFHIFRIYYGNALV